MSRSGKVPLRNTKAAKLTATQVAEIRRKYNDEGCTQGELSRIYGVGIGQIGRIVRGEAWATHAPYVPPLPSAEESLQRVLAQLGGNAETLAGKPENWYDGLTNEEMVLADKMMDNGVKDMWAIRETILKGRVGE
jgi:hypothetical protein